MSAPTQWYLYQIGDLTLNTQLGTLCREDDEINLPQLSYRMLCVLVQRAPAIVSQDELMTLVWGEQVVGDETLKQRIKLLRQVIDDTPQNPKYIASVRGRGYRCIATVDKQALFDTEQFDTEQPAAPLESRQRHDKTHDSINLRLNDRLPVSFMQSSDIYWRLLAIFFVVVFTVFSTVVTLHYFSVSGQSVSKPQPPITTIGNNNTAQAIVAYNKGRSFYLRYQSLDNEMAIKSYLRATQLDPNYAAAFAGLSDAYSQGVFQFSADASWQKKALEAAYDAIMLDDRLAQSYKALGTAHYVNGHLSQALSANLKAIEINPNHLEAHANLGYIYSERGQLKNALERHQIVHQLNPDYAVNWYHIAHTLHRLGRNEQASRWYQKMLNSRANYHLATFHYSRLLIQQGLFNRAQSALKAAEKQSPDSLNVLKGLATFYLLNADIEQAKSWIHKLKLLSSGENHHTAELLSLLASQTRDLPQLKAWYNEHANDYNERPFSNIQLAMAALALNQTDTALRHLTQAIELGWLDSHYLHHFAFFAPLQSNGKFQRILQLLERKKQGENTLVDKHLTPDWQIDEK